jgi:hypothetical protein
VGVTGGNGGIVNATAMAQQSSNDMLLRGGAPAIGSKSGQVGGASGASYALQFGPFGGSLAFNGQVVNNVPNEQSLNAYWQFDASQPVATGKYDFYTVALRSMLSALGFGASDAWKAQADGSNWKGLEVDTLLQSDGSNLITTGGEIAGGLQGRSLVDGSWQPAAMSAGFNPGERRYLTTLDVAFLQDIGYQVVPEPSGWWLTIVGVVVLGSKRRRVKAGAKGLPARGRADVPSAPAGILPALDYFGSRRGLLFTSGEDALRGGRDARPTRGRLHRLRRTPARFRLV